MRCKHCNAKLASHDVWCVECGKQTDAVNNELSAMKSFKDTYTKFMPVKAQSIPGAAFLLICGVIPLIMLIWLFSGYISLENNTAMKMIMNLIIKSISLSAFIPLVLIAFSAIGKHSEYHLSFGDVIASLSNYPKYLVFTLISALYYSLIYLICFGTPNFASLPILRLVWIVLLNYWIAITLPALVLIERYALSPLTAIKKSYRHFHDVRWNVYLLALVLTVINLIAGLMFFAPLVISLPLSLFAIRDYTGKLIDFELLEYHR